MGISHFVVVIAARQSCDPDHFCHTHRALDHLSWRQGGGMDRGYEAFLMAEGPFYDTVYAEQQPDACFRAAQRPLPDGWRRHERDDWVVIDPGTRGLPEQGWKIHASATQDNSERVLDVVWDYCIPRGIHFKFLRSKSTLLTRISKYAPRGYSGKLVTLYPADDRACETILRELGEILDGEPSPYILSDLRWGKGPLYVRYGGFAMQYTVDGRGELVPAIRDADGNLVPDRRDPVFYLPPWVPLPDFLAPHLAARNAVTVADLPYTVERVLHFSNGGGVYVGRDTRTGEQVVLKEGRPHCGLDAAGHDAVRRVQREYDVLRRLDGIPGIPRVHDLFWVGEHRFLAMEFVDGQELNQTIVSRYPLLDLDAGPADYARFTDWAMHIHSQWRPPSRRCTSAVWSTATCTCSTSWSVTTTRSACWTSRWPPRSRRASRPGWATRASWPRAP
jgi:hypothetical protein